MADPQAPFHDKARLRQQALDLRQHLPIERISQRVCQTLQHWPACQQAQTILAYTPFKGEISLFPLMQALPDKQWFLPKSMTDGTLSFHRHMPGHPLITGRYGILEPAASAPQWQASNPVDLILVPGLGFDRHGQRLGYGKGYYDRFLSQTRSQHPNVLFAGIAAQALVFEALPADPWDIPMDYLVTEQGIVPITSELP